MSNRNNVWCLWSHVVGIVIGTECRTRHEAAVLLSDRKANGDAFDGEKVVLAAADDYDRKCGRPVHLPEVSSDMRAATEWSEEFEPDHADGTIAD